MNFGRRSKTVFVASPAQAAPALALPDSALLKIAISPEREAAGGADPYYAPAWLVSLTTLLRRAAASRPLVYAVFTVLYLVPTLWIAKHKLIWDDEFFTLYLSRAGWHSLLQAMATGADQHPPPFYYFTHCIFRLFGMSHITLRLPAIAGFWLLCICLYELVRDLGTPMWGVVAMLFPLSTHIYYYASEARGYGLVTGFAALAALSWFKVTGGRHRAVFLPLLAFSLAAAVSSHYYAGLVFLALAAAELVRTRALGRVDVAVWIALAFTFVPLLVFLPTIRSAREYSTHFWAVPVWSAAIQFYSSQLGLAAAPLIGLLAAGLVFGFGRRGWNGTRLAQDDDPESAHEIAPLTSWQATALYLLAAAPLAAMFAAKFVTHGFSARYAICSIVGIATLAAYLLARLAPRSLIAMAAALLLLVMYGLEARLFRAQFAEQRGDLRAAAAALANTGDEQIAFMDITLMHQLSYYAPRTLATRVDYVADPEKSIQYLNQDTVDRGLLDLRPWFPLKIIHLGSFLADNPRFLVYGQNGSWSWLSYDLPQWGDTRLVKRIDDERMLLSVDSVHVPASLATGNTDPTPMLYEQMPQTGPSLCQLWMGANDCIQLVPTGAQQKGE